jgi:hypothetical protein
MVRQLDGEEAGELMFRLLGVARLSEDEHRTAMLLLNEICGIHLWRSPGRWRWTYQDGRHRARALMDAGVRRILVTVTDDAVVGIDPNQPDSADEQRDHRSATLEVERPARPCASRAAGPRLGASI